MGLADKLAAKAREAEARRAAATDQMRQASAAHRDRVEEINTARDEQLAAIDEQRAAARQQMHADLGATREQHRERLQEIDDQRDANLAAAGVKATYGKFILDGTHIQRGMFGRRPITGVTATIGDLQQGRKGGKLIRGAAILAGSVTAAASAIGRIGAKTLTIAGPDWEWTAEVPANEIDQATAFAQAVNAAAGQQ